MSATRTIVKALAALVILFFGFVAFAHTPWGRPLLGMLTGVPGCPAGYGGGDPQQVEAMRTASVLARTAAAPAAAARPALVRADGRALELGVATRAEVMAWLGPAAAGCKTIREGQALQCEAPHTDLDGPPVGDLHLQFVDDALVAVDVFRAHIAPDLAMLHLQALAAELAARVGPATKTSGTTDPAWLGAAPLRQTSLEFGARGYVATLSITNLGSRGVRLREQYQIAASSPAR